MRAVSGRSVLRVVLVDDHELFSRGLEVLLPQVSQGAIEPVGRTTDASAAAGLVRRLLPDLAVVDLLMPEPGGLRAIAAIRRTEPGTRVIALSGTDDLDLASASLEAGADSYLPKGCTPESLVAPLLAVAQGWSVLPGDLVHRMSSHHRTSSPLRDLGGEERRLWRLLATGRTTVQIAAELHVSERTVKRMTAALLRRLHVGSRAEAAALAGTVGLLEPSEP
jgi:two-component system, NarL family, nitrate/nitrite response regulator NarL